jgi:hypothetical protein
VLGPLQASAWELVSPLAGRASAESVPQGRGIVPVGHAVQKEPAANSQVRDSSDPCDQRAPADREDREEREDREDREDREEPGASQDHADHGAWGAPDDLAAHSCSLARAKDLGRAFRTENGSPDPPG